MPITKQAEKKLRHDATRTKQNINVRAGVKKAVKTARTSTTVKTLSAAFKTLDKAVKNNTIHKNKANRLKARLAKRIATKKTSK